MSQQAQNDFYKSGEEAAMDYADADVVQIDEKYLPRAVADGKLRACVKGAEIVRGALARA